MNIIIFIVILFVLVLLHEFGHFIVAKKSGIRVDEFGLGFPPRIKKLFHYNGTDYTLNWIPFGGFVKIHGENYEDQVDPNAPISSDSFVSKPKYIQALVLVAGVAMNFLVAGVFFSFAFMMGSPMVTDSIPTHAKEKMSENLIILDIAQGSPAEQSGIKEGDIILSVGTDALTISNPTTEEFSSFTNKPDTPINISYEHNGNPNTVSVLPKYDEGADRVFVGISPITLLAGDSFGFFESVRYGFETAALTSRDTVLLLGNLFTKGDSGKEARSSVTGPVGIVSMTPVIVSIGFGCLLSFMAIISVSLAVINLVPFPALDGGRLLFVGIEAITKKQIPPKVFGLVNTIGFFVLIGLMLIVTVRDVINLF